METMIDRINRHNHDVLHLIADVMSIGTIVLLMGIGMLRFIGII